MGKYALVVALVVGLSISALARDNGRYADVPLKYWFDNLTSSNGKCWSSQTAFRSATSSGTRRTVITACCCTSKWINVPNSSVVTEPNRYGPAVIGPPSIATVPSTLDVSCLQQNAQDH